MTDSLRNTWLVICATTGSPDILRSALQVQHAALQAAPRQAMKAPPWRELRAACKTAQATNMLLALLLAHPTCYWEAPALPRAGRPKTHPDTAAMELARWRVSGLTIDDFAVQSRKYNKNPTQRLAELEQQGRLPTPVKATPTNKSATHLLRRAYERDAARVLFDMLGKAQPASSSLAALKQRLMRAQRLTKKDRNFARLVTNNEQLLQWLPGD